MRPGESGSGVVPDLTLGSIDLTEGSLFPFIHQIRAFSLKVYKDTSAKRIHNADFTQIITDRQSLRAKGVIS